MPCKHKIHYMNMTLIVPFPVGISYVVKIKVDLHQKSLYATCTRIYSSYVFVLFDTLPTASTYSYVCICSHFRYICLVTQRWGRRGVCSVEARSKETQSERGKWRGRQFALFCSVSTLKVDIMLNWRRM